MRDAFGNMVGETHYDGSGVVVTTGQAGYVDVAFAFTGRYFDKATGLQNNLNRWYDPAIGRWLSEDPIGFKAGDANLYRYVGNSPTMHTDPTGQRLVLLPPEDDPDKFEDMSFDPSDLVCPIAVAPRIGGSGLYKIYKILFPSKKAAKEAAQHAGKCIPMHHPSPRVGRPHFHPTDASGKKIPGVHYEYPRSR